MNDRTGKVVRSLRDSQPVVASWGEVSWLVGARETPGAEQTFGVVTILPGQRNPLHVHPNCEEVLYVVSGKCEHRLGDDSFTLTPGMAIRIPRGIEHWARCVGGEPLTAVVAFSVADRLMENLEEQEEA
jgi:quercetin dioxygenase-like cupin family protein